MFVPIENDPRDYAWGAHGAISRLLGRPAASGREAELWLGAHPSSPARIRDRAQTGGAADLYQWSRLQPDRMLGTLNRLPFLFKVLAAAEPLSLQAHPSREQARQRYRDEIDRGVLADQRNYADDNHKPELIVALEDGFEALAGVRPTSERREIVRELGIGGTVNPDDMALTLSRLLRGRGEPWLITEVAEVVLAARQAPADSPFAESYRLVGDLQRRYPGDPGVVLSLFLNFVRLGRGEALYLPAGNLHAYLRGIGLELMAASDNVLRGGLTTKRIDVDELLSIALLDDRGIPRLEAVREGDALVYRPEAKEFELVLASRDIVLHSTGPSIVLNLGGPVLIRGERETLSLGRGEAAFITPDEPWIGMEQVELVALARPQAGHVESLD